MKNKILEHSLRKIKNNYKRFLSLLCMAFLGVGFYSSIQITSPEILKTLDNYYDNQNIYDIKIASSLGLADNDIKELEKIKSISKVSGSNEIDSYATINNNDYVIKIIGINNEFNKPYLEDGNLPSNDNEIVVEKKLLIENNLKIGDTITISSLDNKEYKIVGVVSSPLYITSKRDTSNLGSGQIKYYIYMNNNQINEDYYSVVYVSVKDAKNLNTNSKEYNELIENATKDIQKIEESREEARYNELYGEILEQINKYGLNINEMELTESNWYIMNRKYNSGYMEVINASESIASIGKVFPLIFYIIAILIGLISMMRMVEEDRVENGTLKALGYTSASITMKYVIYSMLATVIGGILGIVILNSVIPRIIWGAYQNMMFNIPGFISIFDLSSCLIGLIIGIVCICGCSIFVSFKNLKDKPSNLMRPKSPKIGKRVFFEKIDFLWKKIKFSNKITIRNIFRYKSRVLATIIGILGCSALILTGFGLKDSIKGIVDNQYDNVFHYDKLITLNIYNEDLIDKLNNSESIKNLSCIYMDTITLKNISEQETKLIVPNDEETFYKSISLRDVNNKYKEVTLEDDEIFISKKLASNLNVEEGDKITIKLDNNKQYNITVGAIIENYISQYSYLNKKTYEKIFKEYTTNVLLLNLKELTDNQLKEFDEILTKNKEVSSIVTSTDTIDFVNNMIKSLNIIVVVFIVAAALLAFVVLYNLSNINISERKREIATLKVLGFYHNEVDSYITKENIILTIIGLILGLFLGKYLCYYLIHTCETDDLIFPIKIHFMSYIYAGLITIIFTIIVNIFTHYNLKKIDMVESLKNVE